MNSASFQEHVCQLAGDEECRFGVNQFMAALSLSVQDVQAKDQPGVAGAAGPAVQEPQEQGYRRCQVGLLKRDSRTRLRYGF